MGHDGHVLGGPAVSLLMVPERRLVVAVMANISYADPAADIHMFPNKPMPQRTKQDPNYPFFYKQCKLARRDEHLSRTEYTCDFVQ